METENSKRHYFRCQYQLGNIIDESEKVEGEGYLGIEKMIPVLLKLVMKVKNNHGNEAGGKVALKALRFIFQLLHNVDMDWEDTGKSKSKYLNIKQAKNKTAASERFDVEFLGIGGRDKLTNEAITRLIAVYKKMIREGMI